MKFFLFGLFYSCIGVADAFSFFKAENEASGDFLFAYSDDRITSGMGLNATAELSCAIYLPVDILSVYKDNFIKGVWIGLYDKAANITLFVTESLGGENVVEQKVNDMEAGWHYVELENDVQISDKGLYVGYVATGYKHIGISDRDNSNAAWIYNEENWKNYDEDLNGSVCLKVAINGENMPEREMSMESLSDVYGQAGQSLTITGVVKNNTTYPVESYVIGYSVGGSDVAEYTVEKSIQCNQTDTFNIILENSFDLGTYDVNASILSVNGDSDVKSDDNSKNSILYNKEYIFKKKVVVEEGTGTWCSWCPVGIVGLREMKSRYPDSFIPIAVHVNDQMQLQTYQGIVSEFFTTGLPSAVMDRKQVVYPSFDELEKAYLQMCQPADAGIELEAEFADEKSSKLVVRTKTMFGFSESNANYRIILVLLENGVTGYLQSNGYSDGVSGPMGGFENLPNPVDIEFDEVARGIYKSYTGILKSIPEDIVKGETYDFEYTITVPLNVKDKKNLELVAMIYDVDNGVLLNADKSEISDYSGIGEYQLDEVLMYVDDGKIKTNLPAEIDVFDLNGMRIENRNLVPGIYIASLSVDGKIFTEKVFIK